jgi:hypothetical protein
MYREKTHFWIAPLLGGVLSLIALLTPATYKTLYKEYIYIWMWGLGNTKVYDPYEGIYYTDTLFTDNLQYLIPSIICSILILIFAIILIVSANKNRTGRLEFNRVKKTWYGLSVLLIITTAIWMISYEFVSYRENSESWWGVMDIGFGVIGIFLGSFISIMATARIDYLIKKKEGIHFPYITKQEIEYPQSTNEGGYKTQRLTAPKFCPKCGNEVMIKNSKFCRGCGYEF